MPVLISSLPSGWKWTRNEQLKPGFSGDETELWELTMKKYIIFTSFSK
jgi:hypothetical protein